MKALLVWMSLLTVLVAALIGFPGICKEGPESLAGRGVVLCGASTGIGEDLAYAYARAGSRLVLVARRAEALERVAERCRALGSPEAHALAADLSSEEEAARVVATAVGLLGGPFDVLVLNHIVGFFDSWSKMWANTTSASSLEKGRVFGLQSDSLRDTVKRIVEVNALSYVYLATHAIPVLSSSAGNIVVVSSAAGRVGLPNVSIYSGAKHFLDGFFRSLRHDLLQQPDTAAIDISVVYLGNIATPNAIANTRGELDHIKREKSSDAALACFTASHCRYREVFFPFLEIRLLSLFYPWCGGLLDQIVRVIVFK